MHKLLERQIRRLLGGAAEKVPAGFLDAVSKAYEQADEDRLLLERAMELTSDELLERNEALSHSLSLLQATLEATDDGIVVTDLNRQVKSFNRRVLEMWGSSGERLDLEDAQTWVEHAILSIVEPLDFSRRLDEIYADAGTESYDEIKLQNHRVLEGFSRPMTHDHKIIGRVWSFREVTERRRLEEQIRQSQKMEAVGQLAGGIAHDFNNLLTVISGCCDLSRQKTSSLDPDISKLLNEISKASARASELTSQLLAFSRRAVLEPEALSLDHAVRDVEELLLRLVSENIELTIELDADDCAVLADRTRLQQILLNLVINASDAISGTGRIWVRTERIAVDDDPPFNIREPGDFVLLRIRDDGCGIPPDVQERIFDPFFTTKEPGKGTGLGLATVYGIVRQFGGTLHLDSEPGKGSEFVIAFPITDQAILTPAQDEPTPYPSGGTILAVEDDQAVRLILGEMLALMDGFTVHLEGDPDEALKHFSDPSRADGDIDLLISDIVMPGMNGFDLAERLSEHYPDLKVLFVSGYDPETSTPELDDPRHRAGYLSKPFDSATLARKVHQILATSPPYRDQPEPVGDSMEPALANPQNPTADGR